MASAGFFKATVEAGSTYPFDSTQSDEHRRLDFQAKGIEQLMKGRLIHSPVDKPNKILEIGCGSGATTTQLGHFFPTATVYGLDLAAVPPANYVPGNVSYITGKFADLVQAKYPALAPGTFDLVYSRFISQVIGPWPEHIAMCHYLLAPGGYLELHETSGETIYSARSPDVEDPGASTWGWHRFVVEQSSAHGIMISDIASLGSIMTQAGLGKIEHWHYPFVFRRWPDRPETTLLGEYSERYMAVIIKKMISVLSKDKCTREQVNKLQEEAEETIEKAEIEGLHYRFHVWCGQKWPK